MRVYNAVAAALGAAGVAGPAAAVVAAVAAATILIVGLTKSIKAHRDAKKRVPVADRSIRAGLEFAASLLGVQVSPGVDAVNPPGSSWIARGTPIDPKSDDARAFAALHWIAAWMGDCFNTLYTGDAGSTRTYSPTVRTISLGRSKELVSRYVRGEFKPVAIMSSQPGSMQFVSVGPADALTGAGRRQVSKWWNDYYSVLLAHTTAGRAGVALLCSAIMAGDTVQKRRAILYAIAREMDREIGAVNGRPRVLQLIPAGWNLGSKAGIQDAPRVFQVVSSIGLANPDWITTAVPIVRPGKESAVQPASWRGGIDPATRVIETGLSPLGADFANVFVALPPADDAPVLGHTIGVDDGNEGVIYAYSMPGPVVYLGAYPVDKGAVQKFTVTVTQAPGLESRDALAAMAPTPLVGPVVSLAGRPGYGLDNSAAVLRQWGVNPVKMLYWQSRDGGTPRLIFSITPLEQYPNFVPPGGGITVNDVESGGDLGPLLALATGVFLATR